MSNEVLTYDEGQLALQIARENIESILNGHEYLCDKQLPEIFHEKLGVFVTLNKNNNLRGCIGYPEPYESLIDGLLDVSLSAAFDDPRFNPVSKNEFDDISIEISVLTKPELIEVNTYEEYLDKICIGIDGLIIENGYHRGLFLPQVATEQKWNIDEYLENICYKAGLPNQSWKLESTNLYKFQAQIISEQE